MSETPKVRDRRSVWIHGTADIHGVMANSYETLRSLSSESIVLYCASPRLISREALDDERLAAIVCPTPSPFSHDANLMRTLANDRDIIAVCGLDFPQHTQPTVHIAISPSRSLIEVDGKTVTASTNFSGSDEALGCLLSRSAICYRPMYLYDDWLGRRIARGLQDGIGGLVATAPARAAIDADGRVWLVRGPLPRGIADWILSHPEPYVSMLIDLTESLGVLASARWSQSNILDDSAFLAAFDINCLVAPFVGFPLFSLTQQCADRSASPPSGPGSLEDRVADISRLVPTSDRKNGVLSAAVPAAIARFLESVATATADNIGLELTAAAILLSDTRRIVIDRLRRDYPLFRRHTRHRALT